MPPVTSFLIRSRLRNRVSLAVELLLSNLRPTRGISQGTDDLLVNVGAVKMVAAAAVSSSCTQLTHENADFLVNALEGVGIRPFLVDYSGQSLSFGIDLAHRADALTALEACSDSPGWYLHWFDGPGSGTVSLTTASRSARVRNARQWRIYRLVALGERGLGYEQAAEVTFWELGSSGAMELVGTRGLERFDPRSTPTIETVEGFDYPGNTGFPVEKDLARFSEPVDIVLTWVDGSEEAWKRDFNLWRDRGGPTISDSAIAQARFAHHDELRYALRSIWLYCGWARNIYLVTADQTPIWLRENAGVTLVSHRDILPATALPTFNSHAIEAALHRIPGLAEHFVYFNDDVMAGRALRPETFFSPNGLAKSFPSRARTPSIHHPDSPSFDAAAMRGNELLDSAVGKVATHKPDHVPHPQRRSTSEDLSDRFNDEVNATMHSKFRSQQDISVAASFAQHYGVALGTSIFGEITSCYTSLSSDRLPWYLDEIEMTRSYDSFCINESGVHTADKSHNQALAAAFLERYFPVSAPWENGL